MNSSYYNKYSDEMQIHSDLTLDTYIRYSMRWCFTYVTTIRKLSFLIYFFYFLYIFIKKRIVFFQKNIFFRNILISCILQRITKNICACCTNLNIITCIVNRSSIKFFYHNLNIFTYLWEFLFSVTERILLIL